MLAIVFGAEHINQYVNGIKFVIESDRKLLHNPFSREKLKRRLPASTACYLVYRSMTELQFAAGNTISVADTLSRVSLPFVAEPKFDYQVHLLFSNLPVSNRILNEIRPASQRKMRYF